MNRAHLARLLTVMLLGSIGCAAQVFPRFITAPGHLDEDGLPTSGAKLCILPAKTICFTMSSYKEDRDITYEFGVEPLAERLTVPGGGSWVFFSSLFSGGGSGTLRRLAVLQYDGSQSRNLLPYQAVTNVSDFAMRTLPQVSPYPILVKADFVWTEGESHFASHHFVVSGLTYNAGKRQYTEAFRYTTAKKYDGGDSSSVRVLQPEKAMIVAKLSSASKTP